MFMPEDLPDSHCKSKSGNTSDPINCCKTPWTKSFKLKRSVSVIPTKWLCDYNKNKTFFLSFRFFYLFYWGNVAVLYLGSALNQFWSHWYWCFGFQTHLIFPCITTFRCFITLFWWLVSEGHLCELSFLLMQIQNLVTLLGFCANHIMSWFWRKNLNVTEKTSQKWHHIGNPVFGDAIIL